MAADGDSSAAYLVFLSKPSGYELQERRGEPPAVGAEIEAGETRLRVSKIGPSPLPGDPRPCAYTNAVR